MTEKLPIDPSTPTEDNRPPVTSSMRHFVSPGIFLFIDQLIIAAGGWLFWIMIPKFTTTSDIGLATSVYSLVVVISTITQLGLEYPLLKKSSFLGSKIVGTIIVIELSITAASIVPMFFIFDIIYQVEYTFTWLAIGILMFSSLNFVARFALLGMSGTKTVLALDAVGTAVKFTAGIALVSNGYGATGILLAFALQALVIMIGSLIFTGRLVELRFGKFSIIRETLKDALVNSPSKLSTMLVVSLSVVLLTSYGIGDGEVGIFYIAVMVSIVVGSFSSSLAYMSIPASSKLKTDFSSGSLRLGLAFTAPIIAALIVGPNTILSIIGEEYTNANNVLIVLGLAVLPSVILSNAVSKFNNLNKPSILVIIGTVRIVSFLMGFYLLVPLYGIVGASYAILISFAISAIISLFWSERILLKYIGMAVLSITIGVGAGLLSQIIVGTSSLVAISVAVLMAFVVVFGLRFVTFREIVGIINMTRKQTDS